MKIKGTCKRDGREFFAEQVVASGGECPWDGQPFNADYAAVLVESLRAARNGELGTTAALRDRPDVIVADEIASRAGAFGLARTLRDAA
ncbi:MAG TPA: hypothetical protein VFW51_05490, partial [Actinomycetota bacterium]|nr:hypothetical protein [Actinomycetota bacterium]